MIELPAHSIAPIGIIHSCYPEKFGIPRQPGLVRSSTGRLELLPPCNREEMVRGLDAFSHIWIHFLFHEVVAEGWRPTVRPPWLGGQKRVGVFASRSPHRPNFMGLSVVRLTGISKEGKGLFLEIAELDLLDKTPVLDIKPYVPYSDSVTGASAGFIPPPESVERHILFSEGAADFCATYELRTGRRLKALIAETLGQDPRPASQRRQTREYGMLLWELNVRWQARGESFQVLSISEE
ncbi:MAG: tRNA (N6-threonylcarbamoyladenosine(37)-N6)-methyltransferase TrmO [Desulfoarculaceae bacterium]|nr:tRNA (N6-threonylcarbamoyladenosine(37)-N6)-methyltransferase TrmO [Desulfoarculaceae bacterium]